MIGYKQIVIRIAVVAAVGFERCKVNLGNGSHDYLLCPWCPLALLKYSCLILRWCARRRATGVWRQDHKHSRLSHVLIEHGGRV